MQQKLKDLEFKFDVNRVIYMATLCAFVIACFTWYDWKVFLLFAFFRVNYRSGSKMQILRADIARLKEYLNLKKEDGDGK